MALTVTPGSAHAATVASDFVLPIWQGTSTSAPAVGHQMVCTASSNSCAITIYTVTSGSNCALESITNPASGVGGANSYQNTQCTLKIEGSATWLDVAGQSCIFTPDLRIANWASGINSTIFSTNYYPLVASMVPLTTAGGQLVPNQYALTVKNVGGGLVINNHVITMNERFLVKFNRPTLDCPNPDRYTTVTGNIWDAAADVALSGRDGYFTDTVAAL